MTTPGVRAAVQRLEPGSVVTLFALDATSLGESQWLRFTADGPNELGEDVVWSGQPYARVPIEAEGFERRGSGSLPRPTLRLANVGGVAAAWARSRGQWLGAKLWRLRTLARFLDAANFAAGNPEADPGQWLDREVWLVDRLAMESREALEWELCAPYDLAGVLLPRRQFVQNLCAWRYRGPECGYTGEPVATALDAPTADALADRCGKRLSSCKLRFGAGAELPFGGFPGAGLLRL